MSTFLSYFVFYWPLISSVLLLLVFLWSAAWCGCSIPAHPALRRPLIWATICFAGFTYNYFWAMILCLKSTVGFRYFPNEVGVTGYLLEIVATIAISISAPMTIRTLLRTAGKQA